MRRLAAVSALLVAAVLTFAPAASAELVFERANGSAIRLEGKPRAWCGPWEGGVAPTRSLHVRLGDGRRTWDLSAVLRDIEIGRPFRFPISFHYKRPRKAQLYVGAGRIEASSAEEESSGSLVFTRLSCRPGGTVEFSVDAVLGSELSDGEAVEVSGAFSGRVSKPATRSRPLPIP